jgi:L-seryl-tRNA(Ser) seleniumtransferase
VIAAIRDGNVILHVRTLLPGDEKLIAASFITVAAQCARQAGNPPAK